MGYVFYLHWNEAELADRVAPLRAAGYEVRGHFNSETAAKLGDELPAAAVISLDRLPSHGRAMASWFREAKGRRGIPLIFAGGQPEKLQVTRDLFPDATFCATADVPAVLARVLAE